MTKEEFINHLPDDCKFLNIFDIKMVDHELSSIRKYGRMLKGDRLGVTRDLGRTLTYHIMKEVGSGIVAAEKIEWNDQYALSMLESGSFLVAPIIAQRLANKSHQYDNLCNFLHDKKVIPIRGDYLESSRVLLIKKDTIKIKIQRFTDNRTADGQHFISTSFIIYNPNELREYFIKPEDTTL